MNDDGKRILVTGAAGFIGFHLSTKLARSGYEVVGMDNFCRNYDPVLKQRRAQMLGDLSCFQMLEGDCTDPKDVERAFDRGIGAVVHLAARAGVRQSVNMPDKYVKDNVLGTVNVLEAARMNGVGHFVYASSSSVYGNAMWTPYRTDAKVDAPVSVYAATKKSTELLAHVYSDMFKMPTTGLRFFTVYGPWGRPDMMYYKIADAIAEGGRVMVYNNGDMMRDFTYVGDIVDGLVRVLQSPPKGDVPYAVYNIGNENPTHLMTFIKTVEELYGREADKTYLHEMGPGDVKTTSADMGDFYAKFGVLPRTPIEKGLAEFVEWHKKYKETICTR